jgi:hypothetical protein
MVNIRSVDASWDLIQGGYPKIILTTGSMQLWHPRP